MIPETGLRPAPRLRLAVVVSHPIQHFCPLYAAIARSGRVEVIVLFASRSGIERYRDRDFGLDVQWGAGLLDGFESRFLPGAETRGDLTRSLDCAELPGVLNDIAPDAVLVYGFFHGISRRAIRWARRWRRGVLLIADSELLYPRGPMTRLRKALTVPFFLRSVDVFLSVGDCNEDYYRHYGADPSRFIRCPFPVDEPLFDAAWRRRAELRREVRAKYGLGEEDVVVLGAGKLTERKRFMDAVLAVSRVAAESPTLPIRFLLAGDGPERKKMEAAVGLKDAARVVWAGFVPPEELVALYHASDMLVHPSAADPHPLVTVEAVAAGLPVVVSDRVGSVGPSDDVRPGVNGESFPVGDVVALARIIRRLAENASLRRRYGSASREIFAGRRMARSVDAVEEATAIVRRSRGAAGGGEGAAIV